MKPNEYMCNPFEDFPCEFCFKKLLIGKWQVVGIPKKSWANGYPVCSDECRDSMLAEGWVALNLDEHERSFIRRRHDRFHFLLA